MYKEIYKLLNNASWYSRIYKEILTNLNFYINDVLQIITVVIERNVIMTIYLNVASCRNLEKI